jgi:large subunit ribosomal protein L10
MIRGASEYFNIPICLHMDHATDIDFIKYGCDNGFSSVMYDGSVLPFEENAKNTALVTEYAHKKGITVEADTKLRAELRNAGVEYSVVKNTLTSRACDIVGFENLKDVLSGMTAMATSESDPIAPAKILCTFAEKNPNFVIKAGFVEGNLLDENGVKDLAKTPSKEVLIGKMLGSLQSSLYSFAYVLQAIIDKSGEAPVAEEATEAAAE